MGWNTTSGGFFKGQPCGGGLTGGYVPFAKTLAERTASGDPRRSLEERHGTQQGYLCVVRRILAKERLHGMLLPADAERLRLQAVGSTVLPMAPGNDTQRRTAARACAA